MDRRVIPPKRVTSPTWGPPPPCKQALNQLYHEHVLLISPQVANSFWNSSFVWVDSKGLNYGTNYFLMSPKNTNSMFWLAKNRQTWLLAGIFIFWKSCWLAVKSGYFYYLYIYYFSYFKHYFNRPPPSSSIKRAPCMCISLACVAGAKRGGGRGKGEGEREKGRERLL